MRGGEGKRAAVGKPGLFFFLFRDTLPFTYAAEPMCVLLRAAEKAASTRRFLITCIFWPSGRKGPSRPHLLFTEWWPVKQVISGHSFFFGASVE